MKVLCLGGVANGQILDEAVLSPTKGHRGSYKLTAVRGEPGFPDKIADDIEGIYVHDTWARPASMAHIPVVPFEFSTASPDPWAPAVLSASMMRRVTEDVRRQSRSAAEHVEQFCYLSRHTTTEETAHHG